MMEASFLAKSDFPKLLAFLANEGYRTLGPRANDLAIEWGEIERIEDLPIGWEDEQEPGRYRLRHTDSQLWFGYTNGPQSLKNILFPPKIAVGRAKRDEQGWRFETPVVQNERIAVLGVRACDLAAIAVHDRVLKEGDWPDKDYVDRRQNCLLIAVNCSTSASTCFCTSMQTGPRCSVGFDVALTEFDHGFLWESGSELGRAMASRLPLSQATQVMVEAAAEQSSRVATSIQQRIDPARARECLQDAHHPRWELVAERCLSCANCTLVCPTCFCTSVEDSSELASHEVARDRVWDSCFNPEFSYINGGIVRSTTAQRYRQWLSHKFSTWYAQFDTAGCVGCGRCITWCPPGIDIREEISAICEDVDHDALH